MRPRTAYQPLPFEPFQEPWQCSLFSILKLEPFSNFYGICVLFAVIGKVSKKFSKQVNRIGKHIVKKKCCCAKLHFFVKCRFPSSGLANLIDISCREQSRFTSAILISYLQPYFLHPNLRPKAFDKNPRKVEESVLENVTNISVIHPMIKSWEETNNRFHWRHTFFPWPPKREMKAVLHEKGGAFITTASEESDAL